MLLPIFLTLLFIAVSVPLVASPLRQRQRDETASAVSASGGAKAPTSSYKESLLALRDLEFDHELGLVSDDDYARLRERLMADAASTLENAQRREEDAASERIEAAVRALRQQRQTDGRAITHFCPQCGNAVDAEDRYCTDCGASLARR